MSRPTVEWVPEVKGKLVTFHAHWMADNGRQTSVFETEAQAIGFARQRWGQEPTVIRRPPTSGSRPKVAAGSTPAGRPDRADALGEQEETGASPDEPAVDPAASSASGSDEAGAPESVTEGPGNPGSEVGGIRDRQRATGSGTTWRGRPEAEALGVPGGPGSHRPGRTCGGRTVSIGRATSGSDARSKISNAPNERVPHLIGVPARVRFLSCEPLLGRVDLPGDAWRLISWCIIGGESGAGYRALDLDHARNLRDQAQQYGVSVFFKQVGGPRPTSGGDLLDGVLIKDFPS